MQLKKALGRLPEALDGFQGWTTSSRSTQSTHCPEDGVQKLSKHSTAARLDYEELEGLTDPGRRDYSHAWNIPEHGVVHGYALPLLYLPE